MNIILIYHCSVEIPMKRPQRHIHVRKRGGVGTFCPTLLGKVEVAIFKYGSPLHFLNSSVRRTKAANTRMLARLARLGRLG